jgi:hypothetical protein
MSKEKAMRSNLGRALLGIAVVVVAVVLLIVLKDDDDGDSNGSGGTATTEQVGSGRNGADRKQGQPAIPTIVIEQGKPVGGIAELTYDQGDRVRFRVESDVGDEVHVHGYDLMKDVEAGGSVGFDFPATIEGVFEAELEDRGEQILELRVNP